MPCNAVIQQSIKIEAKIGLLLKDDIQVQVIQALEAILGNKLNANVAVQIYGENLNLINIVIGGRYNLVVTVDVNGKIATSDDAEANEVLEAVAEAISAVSQVLNQGEIIKKIKGKGRVVSEQRVGTAVVLEMEIA